MAARRPYVRPMAGWWRRNPFFLRYMAREATAPFVAIYALVLLAGLVRLAQGPAAFAEWLEGLRSPYSIAFHVVLLAVFLSHAWSWFRIMPKTMAPVAIAGRRLAPSTITALGLVAAAACSAALYLAAWALSR